MSQQTQIGKPILSMAATDSDALEVMKALSSDTRVRMLDYLGGRLANVSEIAGALGIPLSTANLHIGKLEEAGLITTELKTASRGVQKVCTRRYDHIAFQFPTQVDKAIQSVEVSMPIGAYTDFSVSPTCGLASVNEIIGLLDTPASFLEPERINAQLIWFHQGYVEYRFPNKLPKQAKLQSLRLSMEICSEAPLHHESWPSDVTLWINDAEIGTWTSPADFGGTRGALTPDWWETFNTQYGLLKVWQVNQEGSFIDGLRISDCSLPHIHVKNHDDIRIRLGILSDSPNVGGLNLFGRQFGNYPQDIVLSLQYGYE
jgi:predicted transcriptional regulator